VVEDVHIELALMREPGEREVAAAEIADDGVDRIGAEKKIELGVKRMVEESLTTSFPAFSCAARRRRPASSALVGTPNVNWLLNSSANLFFRRNAVWLSSWSLP